MGPILFAILATALIGGISCGWRDVAVPRSLTVTGNHTGTLRDGDVVEIVCNASGILPYSTLRWTSQQENIQLNTWFRGHSPLSLVLRVTPELDGMKYFCSAPFSEINEETDRIAPYTVNSEFAQLTVEGGWPQWPYRPGHVEIASEAGNTHRVGDIVTYSCTTYDIPFTVVDVLQAKGKYEVQLHTGWQPWRQVRLNVSRADHGTELYCRVTTTDPDDRVVYTLVSNRLPVYITSD